MARCCTRARGLSRATWTVADDEDDDEDDDDHFGDVQPAPTSVANAEAGGGEGQSEGLIVLRPGIGVYAFAAVVESAWVEGF